MAWEIPRIQTADAFRGERGECTHRTQKNPTMKTFRNITELRLMQQQLSDKLPRAENVLFLFFF